MSGPADRIDASLAGTFAMGGELPVHRMGFGAMRITGPGVWGPPPNRNEAIKTVRRAIHLGVTLIDTADSYGPHVSESLIADALYPYPEGLVITTKGGYERPGPDRWHVDCHPARLRAALDGSLRRLRVECIDLYQLHRLDPDVPEEDQFEFLQSARRDGKIRHVGLSEVTVEQIERARRFVPIASVQNEYNLIDRRWDAVVDYCQREGIAFMPWAPLRSGGLARGGSRQYLRRLVAGSKAERALSKVAERRGLTRTQIALAWLLARSPVMVPIPGTSRIDHLEENIAAAAIALTPDELAQLD